MSDQPGPVQDNVSIEQEPPDREQDEFEGDAASSEELADWGGGELEAAYLKALSALEASESEMPVELSETSSQSRSSEDEEGTVVEHLTLSTLAHVAKALSGGSSTASATLPPPPRDQRARPRDERVPSPPTANSATKEADAFPAKEIRPTPRQIIEACLFVGGSALTSKRLSGVLRGEFDVEFVDREVDELNRLYAAEGRPYEIRLGEGGFRLTLREEFERIRHKVYGLGPKEVRLSQEALEVLAVVAYHQPIKQARIEELGKPGCGAVLRQLVRRELIAVARDPAHPRDVNYKTTPRFLSLFGIRNLDELPRHEQVSYK